MENDNDNIIDLRGQWLGDFSGEFRGMARIDIDYKGGSFDIQGFVNPFDYQIPSSLTRFTDDNPASMQSKQIETVPIDKYSKIASDESTFKVQYPNQGEHAKTATVNTHFDGKHLNFFLKASHGGELRGRLKRLTHTGESTLKSKEVSWDEFKGIASKLPTDGYIFRGQERPWRLCTSFHRKQQNITQSFMDNLYKVHAKLSALTTHYFDLSSSTQTGALVNLLQHHGYPTPLLDWTYSPYVAAFFAFRGIDPLNVPKGNTRIFVFNQEKWKEKTDQSIFVDPSHFHISVAEFTLINNTRAAPQQALTTMTNCSDIEGYIQTLEEQHGSFVEVYDIPASERQKVMGDLRYMGITAGSIFPGLDGLCEALMEENFKPPTIS